MEQQNPQTTFLAEINTKIRDLEERQRLLKERVLLIGQNLIESKEEIEKQLLTLKITTGKNIQDIEKIKTSLIRQSEELDKKAKKSDMQILAKQMKMFEPLEFVRKQDIEKIKKSLKK